MLRSIPEHFAARADERPESWAITCDQQSITRRELDRRSNRLARAFAAAGLGPGNTAVIGHQNSIAFYEACLAIWKVGAIPLPVSWRLPKAELDQILELAQPRLVIGVDQGETRFPAWPSGRRPEASLSDEPLAAAAPTPWKIQTSGGSTGRPKLVISGTSTLIDDDAAVATYGSPRDGVQLVAGPLYHTAPFSQSMLGLIAGQHLIVMPRFDATNALELIRDHRVQFMFVVPTMLSRMAKAFELDPGRYCLDSLDRVWHTGAPCPEWLKQRWIDLVGPEKVHEIYGGTERQALTTISGDEWLQHRGSVGKVFFGEMKVVDEAGVEVAAGEIGEIYLRSPADLPKTYRYIGAEARTLPGGWESLGEMGSIDAEGYVYLSDRRLDMILVGGSNIYPAEIEGALLEHPLVTSCAVVGLPDDDLGNRIHAVVQSDAITDATELQEFVARRLEPHKIPRSFRFVDADLRNDAGKVRRTAVREQELELLAPRIASG